MNSNLLRLIYSQKKCGLSDEQVLSILLGMGVIEEVAVSHITRYNEICREVKDPMTHPDMCPKNGFAIITPSEWEPVMQQEPVGESNATDTLDITNGKGNAEDMNGVAKTKSEKTKKEFKQDEREGGYKPPKYDAPKRNGNGRLTSVDKNIEKINSGKGRIMDFDNYIKSLSNKTKNENKE